MLKNLLKTLHEIGAVGTMGSFAAAIVLLATAPTKPQVAYAAVLQGIASITKWLLIPSLAIVLVSGLLAIAANAAYKNAAWAWVKALLGIGTFEGTLLTVAASARHTAELSALAVSGQADAAQFEQALHTEWGGLFILSTLALVNIFLGVWRPRLYRSAGRA
ncbi:MAG: hypothetical protein M3O26_05050 [Pseudomonadota bacterium]|nr:hypothetical protein [Pseudomonadota bacterium]